MKQFFIILAAILVAFGVIAGTFYILGMDGAWHRQVDTDIEAWNVARDNWSQYEKGEGLKEVAFDAAKKLIADSKKNPPWSKLTALESDSINNAQANCGIVP
jgi:hypothetical protein